LEDDPFRFIGLFAWLGFLAVIVLFIWMVIGWFREQWFLFHEGRLARARGETPGRLTLLIRWRQGAGNVGVLKDQYRQWAIPVRGRPIQHWLVFFEPHDSKRWRRDLTACGREADGRKTSPQGGGPAADPPVCEVCLAAMRRLRGVTPDDG
jgi:hypothetical protein